MTERLIDATRLVEALNHHWDRYPLKKQELMVTLDIIAMMPEAVVRCKDCIYFLGNLRYCENDVWVTEMDNCYCHWGRRREDATSD